MSASSTPRKRHQYLESLTDLHRFRKTAHGHDGSSRIVMVRKTDQRTFASGKKGQVPKLETITRETIETFRGQKTEYKFTTETKDLDEKCPVEVLEALQNTPKMNVRKNSTKSIFNIECLRVHNEYRKKHGVPPLKLNKNISKVSQQWADILIKKSSIQQSNNRDYGENLFCIECNDPKFTVTGREVVDRWYKEISKHKFGVEPKTLQSGHFTQVVWRDTQELGIGYAKLGGKIIVVANYDPPGNILGHFAENVPPLVSSLTPKSMDNDIFPIEDQLSTLTLKQENNRRKGITVNFEHEFLDKHNEYRKIHGVPPLKLDKDLCRYSETWAEYLANKNVLMHRPESNHGENIFGISLNSPNICISGEEPVNHWYNDMKNYRFGKEPRNLKKGGHFTQVIWKSSEYLGVGVARNNNRIFVVANYSPAGNFVGDYISNVPPPNNTTFDEIGSSEQLNSDMVTSSGTEGNFMNDILEAHNIYRTRHNVDSLILDEDISKYSQEWAEYLAETESLEHNPKALYGENIYVLQSSDESFTISGYHPVDTWYEEAKYYNFSEEPTDEHSYHFTQLIWKNSKKLGVGLAKSEQGTIYVVANYKPPGNYIGEFTKNVYPAIDYGNTSTRQESSEGKGSLLSFSSGIQDYDRFIKEVLKMHNFYRKKHGCPELALNRELCNYAQEWAETLAKKTSLTHRANNKYGENIFCLYSSDFSHTPTARDTVKEWYDEVKFYTNYNSESVNQRALHFTQIIWKNTKELGIGVAKNKRGQTFVVANYSPRGNIGGHFVQNVPKAKT